MATLIVADPFNLDSDTLRLVFNTNATVGRRVTTLRQLAGPYDHDASLIAASLGSDIDGRLWEAVVQRRVGTSVTVSPRDANGYFKRYRVRGLRNDSTNVAYMQFGVEHFPPYADDNASNPQLAQTPDGYGNTYQSRWAVTLGAITAVTQDWWYDVLADYRDNWVLTRGLQAIEANSELSDLVKNPSLFVAVAQSNPNPSTYTLGYQGSAYLEKALRITEAYKLALGGTDGLVYLHTQNTRSDAVAAGSTDFPFHANALPNLRSIVATAKVRGIRFSFHIFARGILIEPQQLAPVVELYRRMPRNGTLYARGGAPSLASSGTIQCDLGHTEFLRWLEEFFLPHWLGDFNSSGMYLDGFLGQGALHYHLGGTAEAPAHGGKYFSDGKRRILDWLRPRIRASSLYVPGGNDTGAAVFGEAPEEALIGKCDLVQDGYLHIPWSSLMAEPAALSSIGMSLTDYPVATRNMAIPTFNAVYHEFQPTFRFMLPWSSGALATAPPFHDGGGGKPGCTAAQLRDLLAFVTAAAVNAGYQPGHGLHYYTDKDAELLNPVEPSGATRATNFSPDGRDPSGVGATIALFARTLHAAMQRDHAGQFVMFGRLQRPLPVDYASAGITKQTNPLSIGHDTSGVLKSKVSELQTLCTPYFYDPEQTAWAFGLDPGFSIPAVLHALWRSPEGLLGMVLVNWTNAAANWIASFNPTLYGILGNYDVNVLNLNQPPTLVGNFGGTLNIGNTASLPDIDIGVLAARSITVVTFTET